MTTVTDKYHHINITTLSRAELARRVGCDPTHITRVLNGDRMPSMEMAYLIANVLNISLDDLYGILMKVRHDNR